MSEAKILLTAEDRTKAAFDSAKRGVMSVSQAADLAGFSLAGLGSAATLAGVVSMVKRINDGVDALNDLKDATGASIENISGLERVAVRNGHAWDAVGSTLIKFNQALGQTLKPGSDVEKVLGAIGLSAKELREMDPAEALRVTAVALNRFDDDGKKAVATGLLFGKSLKEAAPFLKDLAESGQLQAQVSTKQAEEAEKFNKQLFAMQDTLVQVGRAAAGPLVTGFNRLADYFKTAHERGESLLVTLAKFHAAPPPVWFAKVLGIALGGGEQEVPQRGSLLAEINKLQRQRDFAGRRGLPTADFDSQLSAARSSLDALDAASYAALEGRRLSNPKPSIAGLTEGGGKGGGGGRGGAAGAVKKISEAEKDLAYHIEYRRKAFLAAHDDQMKALADFDRAQAEALRGREDADRAVLVSITERAAGLEQEVANWGKLQSEIEATKLARMEESREGQYLAGEDIEAINRRIEAQRRLVDALKGKEAKETQDKAKQFSADFSASVRDDLKGALMRAFEDTENPAKAFATALASVIYSRVAGALADAIADGLVGAKGGGNGGGFGGLLGQLLGSVFGGGSGFSGGSFGGGINPGSGEFMGSLEFHTGGIVGAGGAPRLAPAGAFRRAPRYHGGGIAGDEVPAILKRGEGVFTPGQMKVLAAGAAGASGRAGPTIHLTQHLTVGDVASMTKVRAEIHAANRALIAGVRRSEKYGRG